MLNKIFGTIKLRFEHLNFYSRISLVAFISQIVANKLSNLCQIHESFKLLIHSYYCFSIFHYLEKILC